MEEIILQMLSNIRPDIDFSASASFIDDGLLDSFDLVCLIGELSEKFDVDINDKELKPENFKSIDAIKAMISRLKKV